MRRAAIIIGLAAIAALLVPLVALGQISDEVTLLKGPWHHLPNATSDLQFNRDIAKCKVIAVQTPVDSRTPAVVERVIANVLVNCLKASGYEPGAAKAGATKRAAPAKPSLSDLKAAGGGAGISACAEFTRDRERPEVEALFFSWTEGFLSGWNMGVPDDSGFAVDMSGLSRDEQKQFMRDYCEASPTKRYLEGVTALMSRLRTAKRN